MTVEQEPLSALQRRQPMQGRHATISPPDRAVILHADDLGMCHAASYAFATLAEAGLVLSGSVMVPCPWFPELAAWARQHPGADIGVHLTLNSEHSQYRWGPISTTDGASGLLDAEGYLPHSVEALHAQMSVEAAVTEMRCQIDRALAAGLDITHLDAHMAAVVHPALFPHYVGLALEYGLPALVPRLSPSLLRQLSLGPELADALRDDGQRLEAAGCLLVDHVAAPSLDGPDDLLAQYIRTFDALSPGVTHFLLHPAVAGAEIDAIAKDSWKRVADFQMMMSDELWAHLHAAGIRVMSYRTLRERMRGSLPDALEGTDGPPASLT